VTTITGYLHLFPDLTAVRAAVLIAWFGRTAAGRMSTLLPGFCLWVFGELFHVVHFAPQFTGSVPGSDADCIGRGGVEQSRKSFGEHRLSS
jgi:hypothetical protein